MRESKTPKSDISTRGGRDAVRMQDIQKDYLASGKASSGPGPDTDSAELLRVISFLEAFSGEMEAALEVTAANPHMNMAAFLIRNHLEGRTVTPSALVASAGVPYATARRKLEEMLNAGLIEQRPRTKSGKSFSLHPGVELLASWGQFSDRVLRLAREQLGGPAGPEAGRDYYFGGSYMAGKSIQPPKVLPEPLTLPGGLRILVHGDPTFMVMENLKRQFEQVIGTKINQRAFSIDRLHEEALRNADRRISRYDIIAVDLPWIGEFAEKGLLLPLNDLFDVNRLDPGDFHTAGWKATHWGGKPYGVPSQTTPELLFYRKDWFAEAGLEPPATTSAVLEAARVLHDPAHGRYGVAWNAARGTALGHQFMMACADFGQPVLNLDPIAGGYDADVAGRRDLVPTIDTPRALEAAEYLKALLEFSPPDILSMSWYERIRPYAAGKIAMAYGYTLLAPYFELDPSSPAHSQTGYLPHPAGPHGQAVAPVGGYVLAIPSNLPEDRRAATAEALIAFTSPEAQKLYIQNGSRTAPRYSVGADPDVRRLSTIFEAVDAMSWRDELQFWPRPPVPQISEIIHICGQEMHDMLRGIVSPREALRNAQSRAETAMRQNTT
ncbi:extracellular solute-binding protein [Defluviimonas aestuarii]|uniref:extracellular solute-binding protein n=1 Tax=Albidovulum aestuarii TaxID=1130726 RepID=UPI00249C5AA3|nr:extracellular solute-binding protein [Defluviimonas aestuarii]MDI3338815.1 extracellular solute-binding protein [Defluviimonas aestuarii]